MGQIDLFIDYSYSIGIFDAIELCKLFVLITRSYDCFLRIIFYLKPYNYVQTNDYFQIEIISCSYIIISIR